MYWYKYVIHRNQSNDRAKIEHYSIIYLENKAYSQVIFIAIFIGKIICVLKCIHCSILFLLVI